MSTLYSIGQMNQLGDALEAAGFTPEDVTKLRTFRYLDGFKNVLNGAAVIKALERVFPNWKTIRLGTHKNVGALHKAITDAGFRISDRANDIMGKRASTLASEETEIELVTATVRELGFTSDTRFDAICARIRELGYDLCLAEVGPQLRLQYQNQPLNQWLVIAMEAMSDSDGHLHVFDVERRGAGPWLGTCHGYHDALFYPDTRFVFVRRRSTKA